MAKKRMIDSRIRKSPSFTALDWRSRDLWHGLITVADDQGRVMGLPASVRSEVFPLDDVTLEEVNQDLWELEKQGMILVYQVGNKAVIQIVNWWKYQQKQWAGPSDYPPPDGWVDRTRYHGAGHKIITENWDQAGGWLHELPDKLGGKLPSNQVVNQAGNSVNDNDNDNEVEVKEGKVDGFTPKKPAPADQSLPEEPKAQTEKNAPPAVPTNLDGWQKLLKEEKNKPAVLREMVEVLYPRLAEYPDYGYLGKVAKQVGGAGRLGALIWECSTKNISGDLLAYIKALTKAKTKQSEPAGFEGLREYAEEQGLSDGD